MCSSCYAKNRLDVAAAAGTTCVKCGTDTTIKWYNCKDKPGTKLCISCYQKNQLDVAAAAGTTCVKCGTDTTSKWLNCKEKPGSKLCVLLPEEHVGRRRGRGDDVRDVRDGCDH